MQEKNLFKLKHDLSNLEYLENQNEFFAKSGKVHILWILCIVCAVSLVDFHQSSGCQLHDIHESRFVWFHFLYLSQIHKDLKNRFMWRQLTFLSEI
jgi:hypothetical protein